MFNGFILSQFILHYYTNLYDGAKQVLKFKEMRKEWMLEMGHKDGIIIPKGPESKVFLGAL